MVLLHVGQQPRRRREAAAADFEHVVTRLQALPAEELVDPLPLVIPVAAGGEAVPREIEFADFDG